MSEQEIKEEVLYQEEAIRNYNESTEAYEWLVKNVYAKEDTRK